MTTATVERFSRSEALGATVVAVLALAILLAIWPGWLTIGSWIVNNLDGKLAVNLLVPAVVVVAGWLVAHRLTFLREIASNRRQTRIKVLESAFMALHGAIGRPPTTEKQLAIESAVGQIQLYGTLAQIKLVDAFVTEIMKPQNSVDLAPLLVDLQNSIREELRLPLNPAAGTTWLWLYPVKASPRKIRRPSVHLPRSG